MENENAKIEEKQNTKRAPKKKVVRKTRPASPVSSKKNNSSIVSLVITVLATALVVGVGIYGWQKNSIKGSIGKVSEEARVARLEFENRLTNVKDKLSGAESENEALKAENEELIKKTGLLWEAKLKYANNDLGFSFEYPAIFGQVEITEIEGKTGKMIRGQFSGNDNLVFGGVSDDFARNSTTTSVVFLDSRGFKNEKNNYYFLPMADAPSSDFRMIPMKVIKTGNTEALLISKESFPVIEGEEGGGGRAVDMGEDAGLLMNLRSENIFPAIAFLNSDLSALSLEKMQEIAESFKVE